jgi:predicted XRE-type DNA-binding protein
MKSAKQSSKPGHITTGDIFDDLGFSPEETLEAKIKSDILRAILQHAKSQGYSQATLATILKVHQPDVSNLLKGKISKFSVTRLIQFAGRLNFDTRIEMGAPKMGKIVPSISAAGSKAKRSALVKA